MADTPANHCFFCPPRSSRNPFDSEPFIERQLKSRFGLLGEVAVLVLGLGILPDSQGGGEVEPRCRRCLVEAAFLDFGSVSLRIF